MKIYNRGFGPIAILVIVALGLIIGGGVYTSVKHKGKTQDSSRVEKVEVNEKGNTGTIRDFLSMGKKVSCMFKQVTPAGTTSGTVYINNPMMRGDFELISNNGTISSHMIRQNNDVYVWMGTQGAKMNISNINKATTAPTQSGQVNLDQKVDYTCVDWNGDESKFVLPTEVKFYDVSQMMQGKGVQGSINADIKASGSVSANACSACANVPAGPAREQCKVALNCK